MDDVTVADELTARMPNVACFHAQQAAEKALKAWLVALSGDVAREHMMQNLLAELNALGVPVTNELSEDALALGKFYTTTRYPDALGGADPRTAFLASEANDAVARARRVVESAASAVNSERISDSDT
jgi:HEPN domain-containing protein